MKRGLRAYENEAPVDQLSVRWQIRQPVEVIGGEPGAAAGEASRTSGPRS